MNHKLLKPLPKHLVHRYQGWKATTYDENKAWYQRLNEYGQNPRSMIISCCDSRVQVTSIFGADSGEFFIHRNIANLVPPYQKDMEYHGTSAAIEYAVQTLKVSNIMVLGHSNCGGVQGIYPYFSGMTPELYDKTTFVRRWLEILRPGYDRLPKYSNSEDTIKALEKQTVLVSLENLVGFPFIKSALEEERISLHGLWHNIGSGILSYYNSETRSFELV